MSQTINLMTYADMIDWLVDFQSGNPTPDAYRASRRAILSGLRRLANDHKWTYLMTTGRICTNGPYEEGTIEYDYTGGSVERQLTISDGAWPQWSPYGTVIIGDVHYQVEEMVSTSILQLAIGQAPQTDIDAGTSYTLMRDEYVLPSDLLNIDQMYTPENWRRIDHVHVREWLVAKRYNVTSSNTPIMYCLKGNEDYFGALGIGFYPYPDSDTTIDFTYQRRPRPMAVERVSAGKVTVTEGSTTVDNTDSSGVWTDDLVGSTIRVTGSNATELPTGREGSNPYAAERVVMSVESANALTVDQQFFESASGAKYTISDPVDVEPGVMTNVLMRCCEAELGKIKRLQDRAELEAIYYAELERARVADSRSTSPRSVHTEARWSRRLAYMPAGEDVD